MHALKKPLIFLLGALATAPEAQASGTQVAAFSGRDCTEVGVLVPLPAEHIARYLPAGYTPISTFGAPGMGELNVAIAQCAKVTVDGGDQGPGAISDVGTLVASPDGSPGGHYYSFWELGSSAAHRLALDRAGIAGDTVRGLRAESAGATPTTATGIASWAAGRYEIRATTAVPFTPGASNQWWHEGQQGQARIAFDFPRLAMTVGTGQVMASEGSPLAELLGATELAGAGYAVALDFDARVFAGPRPPARPRLRVRPKSLVAGTRSHLGFRVTRAGSPVAGCEVRVAGSTVVTGPDGRASLVRRFRRPGAYVVRARHGDGPPARARIEVAAKQRR